ncbi:MAG: hypothetical protein ABSF08_02570 [Candidatus Cybelea sp.]|jgi:hypothetical protein
MLVAMFTSFAASKKEPLAETIARIHDGFLAVGFGEPSVRFSLADAPVSPEASAVTAALGIKRISSVARVRKRWPQLERFASERAIVNITESGATEPVDFAVLLEIARGVPRSFPFHVIALHFSAPGFSEGPELPPFPDGQTLGMLMRAGVDIGAGHPTSTGINVKDSWWVNGRNRYVAAMRIVEADPLEKELPAPPPEIAALFAACGKVRKTVQIPMAVSQTQVPSEATAQADGSEKRQAVRSVVREYRAKIPELLESLPHDLPDRLGEAGSPPAFETSGPKKPELIRAFKPLGYSCHGQSGAFTLRRRTPGNLTVKLRLDVGTWSNSLIAFMQVLGMIDGQGFKASLSLPPSRHAARGIVHGVELTGQFSIGGPDRWRQIVDNLAALVAELDGSFVPAIEEISGPSPAWFEPDSA